jgi:hypothetical protein
MKLYRTETRILSPGCLNPARKKKNRRGEKKRNVPDPPHMLPSNICSRTKLQLSARNGGANFVIAKGKKMKHGDLDTIGRRRKKGGLLRIKNANSKVGVVHVNTCARLAATTTSSSSLVDGEHLGRSFTPLSWSFIPSPARAPRFRRLYVTTFNCHLYRRLPVNTPRYIAEYRRRIRKRLLVINYVFILHYRCSFCIQTSGLVVLFPGEIYALRARPIDDLMWHRERQFVKNDVFIKSVELHRR